MIEKATVDAHDESEQATGWFTMFEEHIELPSEVPVTLNPSSEPRLIGSVRASGATGGRIPPWPSPIQKRTSGIAACDWSSSSAGALATIATHTPTSTSVPTVPPRNAEFTRRRFNRFSHPC